jgi:hypothetical protein
MATFACNGAAGICRDRETDLDWKYVQPAVQGHETWKGLYGETDSGTVRCYVKQEIIENVLQENQATYDDSMPMTDADLGHLDPLDRIRILEGCWRIKVYNLSKHILSPFFGNRNISSCAIKDVMGMKRSLVYADDFLNENDREGSHYYLKYPHMTRFEVTFTKVFVGGWTAYEQRARDLWKHKQHVLRVSVQKLIPYSEVLRRAKLKRDELRPYETTKHAVFALRYDTKVDARQKVTAQAFKLIAQVYATLGWLDAGVLALRT